MMISTRIIAFIFLCYLAPAQADTLRIAVATNFSHTAKLLAQQYEQQSGHAVRLAFGATGKHYAQIKHGAPFDIFLAADQRRPALLEKDGLTIAGSRFTYARGRLVLWSPNKDLIDAQATVLSHGTFRKLAIANPKLAPYGRAAQQVLEARGLWKKIQPRLVRGENIGQTFQFVKTGNAQLGFVAAAQIQASGNKIMGSYWSPPQNLYTPIVQQAVLLRDTPAGRAFVRFVQSNAARAIIRDNGYAVPAKAGQASP